MNVGASSCDWWRSLQDEDNEWMSENLVLWG